MNKLLEFLAEANKYSGNLKVCYKMGYDSEKNGTTEKNCHFGLFKTPEMTGAWEDGVKKAKQ